MAAEQSSRCIPYRSDRSHVASMPMGIGGRSNDREWPDGILWFFVGARRQFNIHSILSKYSLYRNSDSDVDFSPCGKTAVCNSARSASCLSHYYRHVCPHRAADWIHGIQSEDVVTRSTGGADKQRPHHQRDLCYRLEDPRISNRPKGPWWRRRHP
jgi:hypothetical protein